MPQIGARILPPDILRFPDVLLLAARNMDCWVCSSVPQLEESTIPYKEKVMGTPIFGVGFAYPFPPSQLNLHVALNLTKLSGPRPSISVSARRGSTTRRSLVDLVRETLS